MKYDNLFMEYFQIGMFFRWASSSLFVEMEMYTGFFVTLWHKKSKSLDEFISIINFPVVIFLHVRETWSWHLSILPVTRRKGI